MCEVWNMVNFFRITCLRELNDSSPNSDIAFFNNLHRLFLYQYYSHKQLFHWCFAKHGVSFRSPAEEKNFFCACICLSVLFYLLSKVTRLTLQESLKTTVKHVSSFYIWLQCSRVSFTCFIDLTCPVNTVCCLLVQSCTSLYRNCCICFLKPWGGTQWLCHSGWRNEEPSSIWFVFFLSFWSKWKEKVIKKGSVI